MKKLTRFAVAGALTLFGATAMAADHLDAPGAMTEPTADITDLFAWMSADANKLNLIVNVNPAGGAGIKFSPAVQYAFHITSNSKYGDATPTEHTVVCQFADSKTIECWAGDEYLTGDPSVTAGIASASGVMRVFAGPRNDPFFMEFQGLQDTISAVKNAVATGFNAFDGDGCPDLSGGTGATLRGLLQGGTDFFAAHDVLSLVVQLDKKLVTDRGAVLGVWVSTHAKP